MCMLGDVCTMSCMCTCIPLIKSPYSVLHLSPSSLPPPPPQIEHSLLRRSFHALAQQMDLIFRKKLWFIMLEQFLMKYIWGLSGVSYNNIIIHSRSTELA